MFCVNYCPVARIYYVVPLRELRGFSWCIVGNHIENSQLLSILNKCPLFCLHNSGKSPSLIIGKSSVHHTNDKFSIAILTQDSMKNDWSDFSGCTFQAALIKGTIIDGKQASLTGFRHSIGQLKFTENRAGHVEVVAQLMFSWAQHETHWNGLWSPWHYGGILNMLPDDWAGFGPCNSMAARFFSIHKQKVYGAFLFQF